MDMLCMHQIAFTVPAFYHIMKLSLSIHVIHCNPAQQDEVAPHRIKMNEIRPNNWINVFDSYDKKITDSNEIFSIHKLNFHRI